MKETFQVLFASTANIGTHNQKRKHHDNGDNEDDKEKYDDGETVEVQDVDTDGSDPKQMLQPESNIKIE